MKRLVEQSQQVHVNDLMRTIRVDLIEMQLKARIEALGQNIAVTTSLTRFGGTRFWFLCPGCNRRVGVLYKPTSEQLLLCRKCHNLTYIKSRYHKKF